MKRAIAVLGLLAICVIGAVLARQLATRQRDYGSLLRNGDIALRENRISDAIESYSGAIALRPDSMLPHLRRGETYRRSGDRADLEAAARDFRKAANLDRSAPRPLEELGDVTALGERFDQAAHAYESAARLDDRTARIPYKLATVRYRTGDLNGAIIALDQAIRIDSRMAEAYYLKGVCQRDAHKPVDAMQSLERAVTLSPGFIAAREELADVFGSLDKRTDQLDQLQLIAGLDRGVAARYVAIAQVQSRRHRWDTAVVGLSAALERAPDDRALYSALGQVWLDSAQARSDRVDLGKAREALERAATGPGAPSELLLLSGRAAIEDGDVVEAERLLQQATERFPVETTAFLAYASVAERLTHYDAARRALIEYEALVDTDPDLLERSAKIASLSLRVGDPSTAAEWIRRGLDRNASNAELLALETQLTAPSSGRPDRAGRRREN